MDKIKIPKCFPKSNREERVTLWVSKSISEKLDDISYSSGLSKQRITELLLQRAIEAVEIIELDIR